jgi:nitroreductase
LVTVRSAESRAVLAAAAGGSVPLTAAPVAVVICTDLARVERITGMPGELAAGQHDDAMLSSVIDASMVGLCLTLAAESAGLGAVMIGAIRNDPGSVARLLALPAGVFPLFAVCVGWPAETPPVHPRLAPRSVIHPERYRAAIAAGAELHDPDGLPAGLAGVAAWQAQVGKAARKLRRRRSLPWQGEGGEEGGRI